jgi:hypothetical protein
LRGCSRFVRPGFDPIEFDRAPNPHGFPSSQPITFVVRSHEGLMPEQGMHCPFLNRADSRCSDYFSIERLDHAFGFCFGQYHGCRVYLELLVERRVRRATGRVDVADRADGNASLIQLTLHGRPDPAAADRYRQHAA